MLDDPRKARPVPLDEILAGAAQVYRGDPWRDILPRLLHIAPSVSSYDRDAVFAECGCDALLAEVCRTLWVTAVKRGAARTDDVGADRAWIEALVLCWEPLHRALALDEPDWGRSPEAVFGRQSLYDALCLYGAYYAQAPLREALVDVLWGYARDASEHTARLVLRASGLELMRDGHFRVPKYRLGQEGVPDVLAVAEDYARLAIRPAFQGEPQTHAEAIDDDRAGIVRLPRTVSEPEPPPAPEPPGVVVIPRIGGGVKGTSNKDVALEFKDAVGKRFPLYAFPSDRRALVEDTAADAPHARRFLEDLVALQDGREHWAIPPFLVLGPPGGGKTTTLDSFFRRAGVHVVRYACDGSSDNAAAGTPRRWNSGEVSLPLRTILDAGHANPAIIWDELTRAAGNRQSGGTLRDALTSMTEASNARRYRDPYLETEVDISPVLHAATANDLSGFPAQLADRFRILHFPLPAPEHMPALARRMAVEIARRQGLPDDHAELDRTDLAALAANWPGGSLRGLQRLVEVAIRVRVTRPFETRH